ncbi:PDZ domain-containing protein [Chengkuizengella sediminis]|uniref:YlbL family protein n=1 Tax=Chengkuizengella sediminis TaxID=1885917 RepID=UPI00138979C2|nr:PDZ domain-containing protein [Chengkuizengella sediminis]NDI33435.1 PDZ domain-containing protein [Chengkuizengella sediminis]
MEHQNEKKTHKIWDMKFSKNIKFFLIVSAILYIIFLMPTPYVVYEPGSAEMLEPMVNVENGYIDAEGAFMLTTVRMNYSNVFYYLYSFVNPHAVVVKKEDIFRNETEEEYMERQTFNMINSQSNAIKVAYNKAGVAYESIIDGVVILGTVEGYPAKGVLQSGDKILSINEEIIKTTEDIYSVVGKNQVGDMISVTYEREEQNEAVQLTLVDLRSEYEVSEGIKERPGIGIYLADLQHIIDAGNIRGPSAGLMFSLEIYNQLVPEDITQGHLIAGTGEIYADGQVGAIGGVDRKIVAADKEGAEVFFVPEENYEVAAEKAQEIKSDMDVVTVTTLEEALKYLNQLTPSHS